MKHRTRIATALAAVALLTIGIASPATAGPRPTDPGDSKHTPGPTPPVTGKDKGYEIDPLFAMPTCKDIDTAQALQNSAYDFHLLGDLSDYPSYSGYGTELEQTMDIIEDGGHSCTWWVVGEKNLLTISITPMSPRDRDVVRAWYAYQYGDTGFSIGGDNLVLTGYTGSQHEVSLLSEYGAWISGKVNDDGDFFPAVLQDVAQMVFDLND